MADVYQSLAWRVFTMPKAGHALEEYEDACAGDPATGRFAIADGASESSFAGAWADLLVKGYTGQPGPWSQWLPSARKTWHENFKVREFTWYAEEKFQQGAYATFLGICFHRSGLRWQGVAIGDSCLFQVRKGRLLRAFPLRHSGAFGNQPDLLGSRQFSKKIKRLRCQGDWQKQDQLFLMTDALAQWFLLKSETNGEPWNDFWSMGPQQEYEAWITKKRELQELRNDDVTLVVLGFEPDPK